MIRLALAASTLLKPETCCWQTHMLRAHPLLVVPSDEPETTDRAPRVLIIDAMVVVQCIKKTPIMTSILHLKTACTAIIELVVIEYMEVRVFFDRYVEVSLKQNTRKKRVT